MALSIEHILNTLKTRYGQLVTKPEDFLFYREDFTQACESAMKEYAFYRPLLKKLEVVSSPRGIYMGDEVIDVRNLRISNHLFNKLSPKLHRRLKDFDTITHILKTPYSIPVVAECACNYVIHRIKVTNELLDYMLEGDTSFNFKMLSYNPKTLSVKIGSNTWSDADVEYKDNTKEVTLTGGGGTLKVDLTKNLLKCSGLTINTQTPVFCSYNPIFPLIEGLSLRDKLAIDLAIGHCLISLGTIKAQLQMENDVVNFNADDLVTQGQALIDKTFEKLEASSTTYAQL